MTKEPSDDNEFARYLASYLESTEHSWLFESFDRTASHCAGDYRTYQHIDVKELEKTIACFMETFP